MANHIKVDHIKLIMRGEQVVMLKSDINQLCKTDCFLSNIINEECFSDTAKLTTFEINEDKNVIMSLIDTMRYRRLIVIPGTSLDYMLALSEKWCLPEFVNELLKYRIKHNIHTHEVKYAVGEDSNIYDEFDRKIPLKCSNCGQGFKMAENRKDSCNSHPGGVTSDGFRYCCHKVPDSQPCTTGSPRAS